MGRNRRESLHSLAAGLYFGALLTASLVYQHPLPLAVLGLAAFAGLVVTRGWAQAARPLHALVPVAAAVVCLNALLVRAGTTIIWDPGWYWPLFGRVQVSLEAVCFGVVMALRLAVVWLAFLLYDRLTEHDRAFAFLAARMPRTALTVLVALRLLPVLAADFRSVEEAHAARGLSLGDGSVAARFRGYAVVLAGMLVLALERSLEMAEAMHARGFGSGRRTHLPERWAGRDCFAVGGAVLVLGGLGYGLFSGAARVGFYPLLEGFYRENLWTVAMLTAAGGLLLPLWYWGVEHWPSWRRKT